MNNLPTLLPTPPFRYRNLKIPLRFFFAVINVNIFSDCHKLNFADWESIVFGLLPTKYGWSRNFLFLTAAIPIINNDSG